MGALMELALSLGLAVGSNQVNGVSETVDSNKVFIGNYVITENVTEEKWIYVDSELDGEILEAADFSGRQLKWLLLVEKLNCFIWQLRKKESSKDIVRFTMT